MANFLITIGGSGTRMKKISPIDKHLLYYGNKRIIDLIQEEIGPCKIIGNNKTNSRYETLLEARGLENCWIIDCDIIPYGIKEINPTEDTIVCFHSMNTKKYGSVSISDGKVVDCKEDISISNIKCSGAYFVRSIDKLLRAMEQSENKNSIAGSMIGASIIFEYKFVRMGDVEDYYKALGI
jgi:dTDP-glucose pyrophosphorylase